MNYQCSYWSATLRLDDSNFACALHFDDGDYHSSYSARFPVTAFAPSQNNVIE